MEYKEEIWYISTFSGRAKILRNPFIICQGCNALEKLISSCLIKKKIKDW